MKFAKRAQKNTKFSKWFNPNPKVQRRVKQPKFCPVICKKQRFEKSTLSYMTGLLTSQ